MRIDFAKADDWLKLYMLRRELAVCYSCIFQGEQAQWDQECAIVAMEFEIEELEEKLGIRHHV